MASCAICNRPLSDPKSVQQGIGPVCWARLHGDNDGGDHPHDELLPLDEYPLDEGVICIREGGRVKTNVPHLVERHSPDGYEWGYGGSGPGELALNICEYYVRILRENGYSIGSPVSFRQGVAHEMTLQIYQDFKWKFIGSMDQAGGKIPANEIMSWIKDRLPVQGELL